MNFNFNISKELSIDDIWLLQITRQNSNKESREKTQPYLESKDLTHLDKYIQKTKEGHYILTKEGREVYDKVTTTYSVEEVDTKITEWLISQYTSVDKLGGNKKKMAYYLSAIRTEVGLSPKELYVLLQHFINDEKAFLYSQKAEKLLFNPGNVFRTKFSPDESPICQYYEQYEEILKDKFKLL